MQLGKVVANWSCQWISGSTIYTDYGFWFSIMTGFEPKARRDTVLALLLHREHNQGLVQPPRSWVWIKYPVFSYCTDSKSAVQIKDHCSSRGSNSSRSSFALIRKTSALKLKWLLQYGTVTFGQKRKCILKWWWLLTRHYLST